MIKALLHSTFKLEGLQDVFNLLATLLEGLEGLSQYLLQ